MGRNGEIEKERQAIMRTVALLFALADLADFTVGRCCAVRALVLWILRPAADVALHFVFREAQRSGAPMPALPALMLDSANANPVDAQRLATCFRRLALTLAQCLARTEDIVALRAANRRLANAAREILQKLRCLTREARSRQPAWWDTS